MLDQVHVGLLSRFQSARAYKQKTWLYHCHTVKYNPLRDQSLCFQLIEGMEGVKTVRFIRLQLTYFCLCHATSILTMSYRMRLHIPHPPTFQCATLKRWEWSWG